MKYILILFFGILLGIILGFQGVFAITGEVTQEETIREMQTNEVFLEQKKEKLDFRWESFHIGNETLGDIIAPLSEKDKRDISNIILSYQQNKSNIIHRDENTSGKESSLSNKEKLQLRKNKKRLYNDLLPYIVPKKMDAYKRYIQSDLEYNQKGQELEADIKILQKEKKERIDEIQQKIRENNKKMRESIQAKLKIKLENILGDFTTREDFLYLSHDSKIILFEKIIKKIDTKKRKLGDYEEIMTSVIQEKIITLEFVKEYLQEYKSQWE